MTCFKSNTGRMNEAAVQIGQMAQRLSVIADSLQETTNGNGISTASYWVIRNRINSMVQSIESEKDRSAAMASALSEAVRMYTSCESMLSEGSLDRASDEDGNSEGNELLQAVGITGFVIPGTLLGPGGNPFANWLSDSLEQLLIDAKEGEGILSTVKVLLKGSNKWGGIGEAGVLEKIVSYIEDLSGFLTGDKKGLTGAGDWFNLADSSVEVWGGLYDYYRKMNEDVKTELFSKTAQENVKILGVTGSLLGLLASCFSASDGLDEKKWQSIAADYIDCGKDIFSVIKSGYELEHIGDVQSLTNIKAGLWSAMDIYGAVVEGGVQAVSQGFRSYEKYYADGQWDSGDTGATGIDISMAGIYGISHKLTLGFDDFIFGFIDRATGGDGTDDMTYYEKAAEGYKILAKKWGNDIANWWESLMK